MLVGSTWGLAVKNGLQTSAVLAKLKQSEEFPRYLQSVGLKLGEELTRWLSARSSRPRGRRWCNHNAYLYPIMASIYVASESSEERGCNDQVS